MDYNKTQKIDSIDDISFLQVICALAVITLHTNGVFWTFSHEKGYWLSANIIECICYFAVPVFFMITGITLINYRERYSTLDYFRKRIKKTVIPYMVWSLIGTVFLLLKQKIAPGSVAETISLGYICKAVLNGNIIPVYWFFPVLFSIYLSIPLFAAVKKDCRRDIFVYCGIAGALLNVIFPFFTGISGTVSVGVVAGYLIWPIIGYVLYYYPVKKNYYVIILIFGIFGLLAHIIGTYKLSMEAGKIISQYKGYNNVPSLFYSSAVFVVLRELGKRVMNNPSVRKVILFLKDYTFSAYLMHYFIISVLVKLFSINTESLLWRLGAPMPIFLIVVGITVIMRKIPIVKYIVP